MTTTFRTGPGTTEAGGLPLSVIQGHLDNGFREATTDAPYRLAFLPSGVLRVAIAHIAAAYDHEAGAEPGASFHDEVLGVRNDSMLLASVAATGYPDPESDGRRSFYAVRLGRIAGGSAERGLYIRGDQDMPHHFVNFGSYALLKMASLPTIPRPRALEEYRRQAPFGRRQSGVLRAVGEELLDTVQNPLGVYAVARMIYPLWHNQPGGREFRFTRSQGWDAVSVTGIPHQPDYAFFTGSPRQMPPER